MSKNQPVISNSKRAMMANKFAELANITIGSLVFGQLLSEKFNATIMIWGLVIMTAAYFLSLVVHPD